jgi:hypothetical protein
MASSPLTGTTFAMAMADAPAGGPVTQGVSLAALPTPKDADEAYTVAMASPAGSPSASLTTADSGFGLEGPAATGGMVPKGFSGTTMLAGLIGVGVLGAGWAWRALVV